MAAPVGVVFASSDWMFSMVFSADALAGPHMMEARLFMEAASEGRFETGLFAQQAHGLLNEQAGVRVAAGAEGALDESTGAVLQQMGDLAAELQGVVVTRAVARFMPGVASFGLEVLIDESPDCDDDSADHVHLEVQARHWGPGGEEVALSDAESEQFGNALNCLALGEMSVARALSEGALEKVTVADVLDTYPVPEDDDEFFTAEVSDEPVSPSEIASALLDDDKALDLFVARARGQHGSPLPGAILDRAARSARRAWVKGGEEDAITTAIFIDEVRFAREVRSRFPDVSVVVASVSDDQNVVVKVASGGEVVMDDLVDLLTSTVLREGTMMWAARHLWHSTIDIDQRLHAVPA